MRFLSILLLGFLVLFGCSEEPKVELSRARTNSIIAIDEANKSLKSYNLETGEISLLLTNIGDAANDIEIDGDYAYIVVSIDNKLLRFNLKDNSQSVLNFSTGSNPYNIVIDENRIYITLAVSNQISVVSKGSFSIITNINLIANGYPQGIRVDKDKIYVATSRGYVSGYDNSRIEIYSKLDYKLITNVSLSYKNPTSLWIHNKDLYIACTGQYNGTGKVLKMNTTNYTISIIDIPATNPTFISLYDNKICVIESSWGGEGGIYIYGDTTSHLLSGKSLKNIVYYKGDIFVSEGYSGVKTYRIKLSDLSISEIGIGGGDIAIY